MRGCVEGYRLAYAPRVFDVTVHAEPVPVLGAPDLLAQMLDKLVENAVDFATSGTAIRVFLTLKEGNLVLRIENLGPSLPDSIRESLFDSMVSLPGGGGVAFEARLARAV